MPFLPHPLRRPLRRAAGQLGRTAAAGAVSEFQGLKFSFWQILLQRFDNRREQQVKGVVVEDRNALSYQIRAGGKQLHWPGITYHIQCPLLQFSIRQPNSSGINICVACYLA